MTKANVGDYIKVADSGTCGYYQAGAGGKVLEVYDGCVLVAFTFGAFDRLCGGRWWVNHGKYTVEQPYSATFTVPVRAEAPQGHVTDGGGLQKHSVGDLYPLAAVGYARDSEHTVWVVENLETGEVACWCTGAVRQWPAHALAVEFAERCKQGIDFSGHPIRWVKGRPHFKIGRGPLTEHRSGISCPCCG